MERLSGETLLTYVGGRASGAVPSVACVSTDSRKIGRECLFIPLKGERMDGHDFIRMAAENGHSEAARVLEKLENQEHK